MASLLPDEIMINIIKEITPGPRKDDTRERDLLSLQLTSKQWFRIATEVAYRSIYITNSKTLHRLLHTVLYYPGYATLIKELKLDYTNRAPLTFTQVVDYYSHTYGAKMLEAIASYNLEDADTYALGRLSYTQPTQQQRVNVTKILMLMCVLPKLRSVSIAPRADLQYLMKRFAALSINNGHTFPTLRTLKVELHLSKEVYGAASLYPLFMIRPATKLVLRNLNNVLWDEEFGIDSEISETTASISSIEKLIIWNSRVTSRTLEQLLSLSRHFKEFKYQDAGPHSPGFYIFPRTLVALSQLSHSLVILCLCWTNTERLYRSGPYLDLRTFVRLEKVAVAIEILLGCYPNQRNRLEEVLPNGLEVVYLRLAALWPRAETEWARDNYVTAVRELLLWKSEEVFPKLKVIGIGGEEYQGLLYDLAKTKGVDLVPDNHPESFPFD